VIPPVAGEAELVQLVRTLRADGNRRDAHRRQGSPRGRTCPIFETPRRDSSASGANAGFRTAVDRAATVAWGDLLVVVNDDIEPQPPDKAEVTVPFFNGLRRRYTRANRLSSTRNRRRRGPA